LSSSLAARPSVDLMTIAPARTVLTDPSLISTSNLVRFWELRGRRVFEAGGIAWGQYKGGFYTPLPIHRYPDLSPEAAGDILRRHRVRGLRFLSHSRPGAPSGMYVLRPDGYGLQSVSRKQRGNVNSGLDNCQVRIVQAGQLRVDAMQLNLDTVARHGRSDRTFCHPVAWSRFLDAVERCPGMTVHAAFRGGRLAAYLISIREGEWLHLLYKMSRAEDLQFHPNQALDFSVLRWASGLDGVRYVSNGPASLLPGPGLDRYKRQWGFDLVPLNLCLHFHPLIAPFAASPLAVRTAKRIAAAHPEQTRFAYAAAVLEASRASRGGFAQAAAAAGTGN
jgi:hypothetical protein